ncbi:aspartate aminotransferase family protein [Marinibaculum pumilum]|uniref:Aspartate aminotransferase family protein n=1 Tax=Marinibaculum pumilum TaxID=1766165 RepID=A0ABV7KVK7_9PROT
MAEARAQHSNLNLDHALAEAESRFIDGNAASLAAFTHACEGMPGGTTRNVLYYPPFPLNIVRGEGARVWDADGHAYTDWLGDMSAGLFGHSNPEIRAAAEEALAAGLTLGGPNRYEAALAEAVCSRFPAIELVRFTNSGSEGSYMAIATARAVTGRPKVMVMESAYHGGHFTFGRPAAPGGDGGSPLNVPFEFVLGQLNDWPATEAVLAAHGDSLAAVVVEPVMGAGGCLPADPDFLQALRDWTTAHGSLLVFDEVMTSRLAPGGMQGKLGIHPDLTVLGKWIGGGFSFGGFGGRADIMARFDPRRPDALSASGTFNNNVMTMAAGLAGLTRVYTPDRAIEVNARGDRLRDALNAEAAAAEVPFRFTGAGSLIGIHPVAGEVRSPRDTYGRSDQALALYHLAMLEAGHYLARRGYMALNIELTDEDCAALTAATRAFLDRFAPALREAVGS